MQQVLFLLGILLGRIARHPPRVPRAVSAVVRAAVAVLTWPPSRNAIFLGLFYPIALHDAGEFAATFLAAVLAWWLPWRTYRSSPSAVTALSSTPAPSFDEAAFAATLVPLPDPELRRMADQIAVDLQGPLPAQDRQDRVRQRRLLYRTLDERRSRRQIKAKPPPSGQVMAPAPSMSFF